jgi:hypothetical protein
MGVTGAASWDDWYSYLNRIFILEKDKCNYAEYEMRRVGFVGKGRWYYVYVIYLTKIVRMFIVGESTDIKSLNHQPLHINTDL